MPFLIFILCVFLFVYVEFSLMLWAASHIGVLGTLIILLLSAAVGIFMLRTRGLYSLFSIKKQLAQGEMPTKSVLNSIRWMVVGILFLLPGLLTDLFAIGLLVFPVTHWLERILIQKFSQFGQFHFFNFSTETDRTFTHEGEVFEAEYEKQVDEDKRIK